MSTDWNNYNEFMGAWDKDEADNDIQAVIDEHALFKSLADIEYEVALNGEFDHLIRIADRVKNAQIAAATASIAADAAAIAGAFTAVL